MAKKQPIDQYAVSVIFPTPANPSPSLLLEIDKTEFRLTSAQAVYLAGLLLEGAGRSLQFLDEDHQIEVAQLLGNLFQRFDRPS